MTASQSAALSSASLPPANGTSINVEGQPPAGPVFYLGTSSKGRDLVRFEWREAEPSWARPNGHDASCRPDFLRRDLVKTDAIGTGDRSGADPEVRQLATAIYPQL
ncbi:hypothetical protein [Ferrimicrobium acidiphilum]|uniref:hypothetical protein n=1 Tax=Ferrimicrobium acidiphilum TaxID=121039 RepID=UPI0023F500CB|nr:hypothetical protein [Ferrimicrobium acidiphilum]